MSRDLILGAIRGYGFETLRPFVASLKAVGYRGDACLFACATPRETLDTLHREGVRTIPFREARIDLPGGRFLASYSRKFLWLHPLYPAAARLLPRFAGAGGLRRKALAAAPFFGIWCSRYLRYLDFLSETGPSWDRIMLCDIRDVVFQRDPFDFPFDDSLHCFLEDDGKRIGDCPHNSAWIDTACGEGALAGLARKPICCSGVTMGSYRSILEYLELMAAGILSLRRQMPGIDQGIHNDLVHNGRIARLRLHDNLTGPVFSMHYAKEPVTNAEGLLTGSGGHVYNVVHQYDRHPAIVERIAARLGHSPA